MACRTVIREYLHECLINTFLQQTSHRVLAFDDIARVCLA